MLELGCLRGVIVVRGEAEMPRLLCLVGVPRVEEVAVSDSDREITPHETRHPLFCTSFLQVDILS